MDPVFTHMLELSSKVGSALAAIGANDLAGSVLTEAAEVGNYFPENTDLNSVLWQFEKLLQTEGLPQDPTHERERIHSVVLYYASRMEAVTPFHPQPSTSNNRLDQAWNQGTEGVALWMLEKIVGQPQDLQRRNPY